MLPRNRTQQATFEATLDVIQPLLKSELSREQQIELISEAAMRNRGHSTPSQDCLLEMATSEGVAEALRRWPRAFLGHLHCESILVLMLFESGATKARVGVTKLCCACCAAFLETLVFKKGALMQHGQVFLWSPPQGTPQHVKEKILHCFARHVAGYLDRVTSPDAVEIGHDIKEEQTPLGSEPQGEPETTSYAELNVSQGVASNQGVVIRLTGDDGGDDSGVEDNKVADEDVEDVEEEVDDEDQDEDS